MPSCEETLRGPAIEESSTLQTESHASWRGFLSLSMVAVHRLVPGFLPTCYAIVAAEIMYRFVEVSLGFAVHHHRDRDRADTWRTVPASQWRSGNLRAKNQKIAFDDAGASDGNDVWTRCLWSQSRRFGGDTPA